MSSPSTSLRRELGLIDVFAICTGAMFSSGFFLLPGLAFEIAGAWMVAAYALSALLVVPAMLSKAELASALPRAGGTYYYLDRSMGPLMGTVGGLGTWVAMGLKNTFALIGIGAYLALFVDVDVKLLAVLLAVVFTLVNLVGTKATAGLQRWLVYALVGILTGFVLFGLGHMAQTGLISTARESFLAAPGGDVDGLLATVGLVFVSYAGLTKVSGVAEEVKRPERNILLGMVLSLGVATSIYVLGAAVLVAVVPHDQLLGDLTPIATAAEIVFAGLPGKLGLGLIVVAAVAAFASTANAGIMAASRYLLAMGRDRLIGSTFARLGRRFRTPTFAVLTTGGVIVAILLTFDVVSVAKLASAFQLLMFGLVNIAVIVMRESRIETYTPSVRTPLYPWVQLAGVFLSLGLIVEMGRMPMLFTLGLVGLCVGWYFVYAKSRVVRRGAILHWFERLGRDRFDALEDELWTILKDSGLQAADPYDGLVQRAELVEVEGDRSLDQVAQRIAAEMAPAAGLDAAELQASFVAAVHRGLVPLSHGFAVPHAQVEGCERHALCMVRAPAGVRVEAVDGGPPTRVQGLFFLLGPAGDSGQHLRLLAKIATQIEQPEFQQGWLGHPDAQALRQGLIDDQLSRFARRLTSELRTGGGWHPVCPPGRFESLLLAALPGPTDARVTDFARALSTHHQASFRAQTFAQGTPWLELIRAVLAGGHDLVVVQADDQAQGFGSSILHLLRKCPCPVWVVRPERAAPRQILAAVDATTSDSAHSALNTQILAFAAMAMQAPEAELHLVHAWRPADAAELAGDQDPDDWRARYQKLVEELLAGHPIDRARTHVHLVEGEPAQVIADTAARLEIDLVVMGTVCRTGVAGFLIGNTAETVLRQVACSVLAVKPPGFITPVEPHAREEGEAGADPLNWS